MGDRGIVVIERHKGLREREREGGRKEGRKENEGREGARGRKRSLQ